MGFLILTTEGIGKDETTLGVSETGPSCEGLAQWARIGERRRSAIGRWMVGEGLADIQ